jgi:hypothetical protein
MQLTQNFFDKHLKGADVPIDLVPKKSLWAKSCVIGKAAALTT